METVKRRGLFGKREMDMTKGNIFKEILVFALPLMLGNLFQQLYNMVDTWVIGQTGESGAYAAVGTVGPIINILIGFFSGLASGAGVVISQYYGKKDEENIRRAVHTAMTMTVVLAVLFTVIGITATPWLLRIMLHAEGEADAVYPFAKQYLTIYFAGVAGLLIYNMGSGILRAIGDSIRPFYYLCISAVINIWLDIEFTLRQGMGVRGVAYATIIAQAVSAILTLISLFVSKTSVKLRLREMKIDFSMLGRIVKVGIPAALQMALTAFSNVFVQSYIAGVNGDKTASLGGWTTYSKVDQLIFLPIQSVALAATTFVGQNVGVGNYKRAKRGTFVAWGLATGWAILFIIPIVIFAPALSRLFNPDPAVVDCAVLLLRNLTYFYLFCPVNQVFTASMRGAGNSRAPLIILLSAFVGFRQLYLFVMSSFISNDLLPIGFSYPAGWGVACLCTLLYFRFFFKFEKNKLTQ